MSDRRVRADPDLLGELRGHVEAILVGAKVKIVTIIKRIRRAPRRPDRDVPSHGTSFRQKMGAAGLVRVLEHEVNDARTVECRVSALRG